MASRILFRLILLAGLALGMLSIQAYAALPAGFTYIDDAIPGLKVDLRYAGNHNFVGRPVAGYESARPVLSTSAANALARVQADLKPFNLGLLVFDAYRPQRAVDDFVKWAADPADVRTKAEFYPDVDKRNLFKEDYIAERSGHSRGSTVDLTLAALDTGEQLDMGSAFDFFGVESWPEHPELTAQQRANRLLLRTLMLKHGFKPYPKEWWHFTLENEPFPQEYFDFLPQ
ncbi:M15 family metallopeptidase [Alcaligenaceae bacterium]|nr:M15 family metallopeptidase [Alcaligenaceae bacterium]